MQACDLCKQTTPGLFGRGIQNVAIERYDRHDELTAYTFAATGVDPNDFIGFRMIVQYPMIGMHYHLSFEVSTEDHESSPQDA